MGLERVDALSREDIPFTVRAFKDGEPLNLVTAGATVDAAFLLGRRTKPEAGDWKACTIDADLIGLFTALCNVGPGGTVTGLVAGKTYYAWVRVTVTGELVIRQVGRLIVE